MRVYHLHLTMAVAGSTVTSVHIVHTVHIVHIVHIVHAASFQASECVVTIMTTYSVRFVI